ncbi:YwdI family protein [Virgibacillus byunsanensis]|uniref:YwdI family protein n=1 Tax=Virgibacillus byunsanensis TaxID=570945 RepID=A0ABW3LEU4_9BACI
MAVANKTIIQKMITELQQALEKDENHTSITNHISNVRLLCDLMVGENSSQLNKSDHITNEEMKAMIKGSQGDKAAYKRTLDDDSANGDSIFDF